jgi:hypothetical protein
MATQIVNHVLICILCEFDTIFVLIHILPWPDSSPRRMLRVNGSKQTVSKRSVQSGHVYKRALPWCCASIGQSIPDYGYIVSPINFNRPPEFQAASPKAELQSAKRRKMPVRSGLIAAGNVPHVIGVFGHADDHVVAAQAFVVTESEYAMEVAAKIVDPLLIGIRCEFDAIFVLIHISSWPGGSPRRGK